MAVECSDQRAHTAKAVSTEYAVLEMFRELGARAEKIGLTLHTYNGEFCFGGVVKTFYTLHDVRKFLEGAEVMYARTPAPEADTVVVGVHEIEGAVADLLRTVVNPEATKQDRLAAAAAVLNSIYTE